jgi:hypothetical protein
MDQRHGETVHLEGNRPLILERAAIAGAAGLQPLPLVDDLLAGAARGQLVRNIAERRGVGVDDGAVTVLSQLGEGGYRSTTALATRYALRRSFRRLATVFFAATHAGDFATTFAIATLFDHYCARHHVGAGLDQARARVLRRCIDAAIGEARQNLARRGARSARRIPGSLLEGPRALGRRLAGRLARRPPVTLSPPQPAAALGPIPAELIGPEAPAAGAARGGVLDRTLGALGGLIARSGRGYVVELVRAFDRAWAARP